MVVGLTDWVTTVVEDLGYIGVASLVALENLFPPIPSEVVLPLAGFVSATGDASLPGMILAASIGSLIGAVALYGVSGAIGPVRLRRLVERHGHWFGLDEDDLNRSEQWFDQRAVRAVLLCRCVPLMRSLISIPAGFRRMPLAPFMLYTLAGSAIWNFLLIGGGHVMGANWERVGRPVEYLQSAVVAGTLVAVGWFLWRRILRPRFSR